MKVIRAGDAIRHSFFDGSFDVLCSIAALNTVHAHPLSRSIYNICAIYFITEAHCGYNFPYMLHNIFPSVFAGPERHLIHHKKGTHNYQKFFIYIDSLIGTAKTARDLVYFDKSCANDDELKNK